MSNRTLYRRLEELEECERISTLTDLSEWSMPHEQGGSTPTTIYNLNGLNQLAMVEMKNKVLNETAKKFSDILSEVETTGSYSFKPKDSYMIEDPIELAKAWIVEQEAKVIGKPLQERIIVVNDQERKTYLVPNEVYRLVMDRIKNDKIYLKRMKETSNKKPSRENLEGFILKIRG